MCCTVCKACTFVTASRIYCSQSVSIYSVRSVPECMLDAVLNASTARYVVVCTLATLHGAASTLLPLSSNGS
jgi:hypothetical protein